MQDVTIEINASGTIPELSWLFFNDQGRWIEIATPL